MKKIGTPTTPRVAGAHAYAAVGRLPVSPVSGGLVSAYSSAMSISPAASCPLGRRLSLYADAPSEVLGAVLTFSELERAATGRFGLLRLMDEAALQSLRDDELGRLYDQLHAPLLPLHRNEAAAGVDVAHERLLDRASHYVCRFVFGDNADDIRFFTNAELSLFRYQALMANRSMAACSIRYAQESSVEKDALLDGASFVRRPLTDSELQEHGAMLEAACGVHPQHVGADAFLAVPFELVPDLLGRAQLVLAQGEALVCRRDGLSVLTTLLREGLERAMASAALELANNGDARLLPFVRHLRNVWAWAYSTRPMIPGPASLRLPLPGNGELLRAGDIEEASTHFPPCMRQMHERLRQDAHLKYQGRQQLSLFLKSIGVPLQEALVFWRQAFGRRISNDQFARDYAYNVRHNYGQEGKRANYACPPCARMLAAAAGPAECHGCPLRQLADSADGLAGMLQRHYALDDAAVAEIGGLVRGGHFQLACTKTLRAVVGSDGELPTITMPTDFYFASRRHRSQ